MKEDYLLQTKFPSFSSKLVFIEEFKGIELLKQVINETRKTRSENKIDPAKRIKVFLKTDSEREKKLLSQEIIYFNSLTRSIETEITDDFSKLSKGFRGVIQNWEILLPFNEEKDRINELNRLQKEFEIRAEAERKRKEAEQLDLIRIQNENKNSLPRQNQRILSR